MSYVMLRCVVSCKSNDVSEVLTASIISATMETVSTSQTWVNFKETTWHKISRDSHRHIRRRENLKSHRITTRIRIGGRHYLHPGH
jgi:hypothetical protein